MNVKFLAIAGALMLAIGGSFANAGTIADGDGDLVPDVLDNCPNQANGPATGGQNIAQTDSDSDGFGDACDCDFVAPAPGDGIVLGDDIVAMFGVFNTASQLHDVTGDGIVLGDDVVFCFGQFNGPPGV